MQIKIYCTTTLTHEEHLTIIGHFISICNFTKSGRFESLFRLLNSKATWVSLPARLFCGIFQILNKTFSQVYCEVCQILRKLTITVSEVKNGLRSCLKVVIQEMAWIKCGIEKIPKFCKNLLKSIANFFSSFNSIKTVWFSKLYTAITFKSHRKN